MIIGDELVERLERLGAAAADPPELGLYNPDSSAYRRAKLDRVAPMAGVDEFGADVLSGLGWDTPEMIRFRKSPSTGSSGSSLQASVVGALLVARARFRDARSVVDEFENLVTRNAVDLLEVVPLWGVQPDAIFSLLDEIELRPLRMVPPSLARDRYLGIPERSNQATESEFGVIPKPRAALTRRFTFGPIFFREKGALAARRDDVPDAEQLFDVARSLTAILRKPIFPLAHWYQADESLPLVGGVGGWGGQTIYWPFQIEQKPETLDAASLSAKVAAYLDLPEKTRAGLRIALERLRAAQIHSWYHERIMDLGIALEATLFGGGERYPGEIKYRFTIRGTVLYGGDPQQRKKTASLLKALYDIRSRVAHGGASPHENEREVRQIEDGIMLCAELVERIIDRGDRPNWDALVMGWSGEDV